MRIVYGVSGEGSGHSSRAREMAGHLVSRGHDLWIASYDRGVRNLRDDFRIFEVEGLHIASEDNRVSIVKTFSDNLMRVPSAHRRYEALKAELFETFQPDVVITDFEPMTAYLALQHGIPLVTIDNQHRMRYVDYACPPGSEMERQITKNIIRAMVPRPDVSLVTLFCPGNLRNERTFLFPPILRADVLRLTPRTEGHLLVYVTQRFDTLIDVLHQFPREEFRVYGYDKDEQDNKITYRPFGKETFLDDLAACKGVIATAGFTLISEALAMGKPYLALPMRGQFEQELNAFQLESLGYGKYAKQPTAEAIGDFLYRLPDYRERLNDYHPGDNSEIKAKLDELLANDGEIVRQFHRKRAM